ncbi:hypothetical protein [Pantoea sp.]|uniref:hypothetical protein n=1 Tax=Pantoea sp. TaxID=69393 RepID=UPI0028ADAD51|nr:hypothetical protein [Pantoea sp.]
MQAYTEEQRAALIERLRKIKRTGKANRFELTEMAEIALAALTKEPAAYMYRDKLHTDARFSLYPRFGNWSPEDINEYEITETRLYTAPPVAALRLPGELKIKPRSHESHVNYAEGWNDCLDETKRLNASAPAEEKK